ncbi:hypothetical protein M1146_03535 [Patescibacteria group bacterium]|nr:hypothetical protein [Patescibacteria group bacterium]
MDRFNNVSDEDSLRAVAEITALGGYLGCVGIEPTSDSFKFYKECVDHIYEGKSWSFLIAKNRTGQEFRSVMSSGLIAAVEGNFGFTVPESVSGRVRSGNLYLWPMMAMIWGFNPEIVAERSLVSKWIRDCDYYEECAIQLDIERRKLSEQGQIKPISNIPTHQEILTGRFSGNNTRDVIVNQKKEEESEEEGSNFVKIGAVTVVVGILSWLLVKPGTLF